MVAGGLGKKRRAGLNGFLWWEIPGGRAGFRHSWDKGLNRASGTLLLALDRLCLPWGSLSLSSFQEPLGAPHLTLLTSGSTHDFTLSAAPQKPQNRVSLVRLGHLPILEPITMATGISSSDWPSLRHVVDSGASGAGTRRGDVGREAGALEAEAERLRRWRRSAPLGPLLGRFSHCGICVSVSPPAGRERGSF